MAYKYTVSTSGQIYKDGRLIPKENYKHIPDNYVNQSKAITNPTPQGLTQAQSNYSYGKPAPAATTTSGATGTVNTGLKPAVAPYNADLHRTINGIDYGISADGKLYANNKLVTNYKGLSADITGAVSAGGFANYVAPKTPEQVKEEMLASGEFMNMDGMSKYLQEQLAAIGLDKQNNIGNFQAPTVNVMSLEEAAMEADKLANALFAQYERDNPEQINQNLEAQGLFGTGYGARLTSKANTDMADKKAQMKNTLIQQLMGQSREDAQNTINNALNSYNATSGNQSNVRNSLYNLANLNQNQSQFDETNAMKKAELLSEETIAAAKNETEALKILKDKEEADRQFALKEKAQRWEQGGYSSKAAYEKDLANYEANLAIRVASSKAAINAKYKTPAKPADIDPNSTAVIKSILDIAYQKDPKNPRNWINGTSDLTGYQKALAIKMIDEIDPIEIEA